MLAFEPAALTAAELADLATLQAAVDSPATYEERVKAAKDGWSSDSLGTAKEKLRQARPGVDRCVYCEDSLGDEVDHLHSKTLFPEKTFSWPNFVCSCGPCNGPKSNRHAIVVGAVWREVTRKRKGAAVPPPAGTSAWIDPRSEDPLALMELDILGDTFLYFARTGISVTDAARAEWTIVALHLNDRAALVQARRVAYGTFRARLKEYATELARGAAPDLLLRLRTEFATLNHPSVWREVVRQRVALPEWGPLFTAVPDALNW